MLIVHGSGTDVRPRSRSNASRKSAMAEHISSVAAELFYKEGIYVGVDRIAAKADVTKRTLYRYYASKDILLAAALNRDLGLRFPRDGDAAQRIIGAFRAMGAFLQERDFRGCPFINAAAELSDPKHPAFRVIQAATSKRRRWFYDRAIELESRDPKLLAEQIELLFDGALVGATRRGEMTPVDAACSAIEALLSLSATEASA